MAHIGLLDIDITPVDRLVGNDLKEILELFDISDIQEWIFGKSREDAIAMRIKIDYNTESLVKNYGYRLGDTVGVTVTSDAVNNSAFYEMKSPIIKTQTNSVYKYIGNIIDRVDYLVALIPTTTEKVNFYFTQSVDLGNLKIRTKNPPQDIIDGTETYTINMTDYVSSPTEVDSFTIDPIYLEDSWDSDNLYAKIHWTHNYDNSSKKIYDRILWYDIYCENSLIGSITPKRVYYDSSNQYTYDYKLPGLLLQEHMRKVYEETNITQESIEFSIITVKAGLINSSKRKYTTTLYYKRPIYVEDMWIRSSASKTEEIKIYNDMTYTGLANSGKSVWDEYGSEYTELVLRWKTSEEPTSTKVKVYTYFGNLSAKLDIFRIGTETDVSSEAEPDSSGIYSYSYPTFLNRTAFEVDGKISDATDYNGTVAKNCTRYVAFEVTVTKDKGSSKKRSQVIKIERRPIIRNYALKDTENGFKYFNYEDGFHFNFYNSINGGNLENAEISWGIDRVTIAEWLGINLDKDNKSFSELVSMYTSNFFNNILTTYERTRNILSPVWFEMYLVVKSDYYFDTITVGGKDYITLVSPFDEGYLNRNGESGLVYNSDNTRSPEFEYLIDSYDKDFMDWLLSADHQHHITVDKDNLAFYENDSESQQDKLQTVINSSLNKKFGKTVNFETIENKADLKYMFRRLIDINYATFRLYQYEYLPSIYLQKYPTHWECPVCKNTFVVAQIDSTGTLYVFDSDESSSYYKNADATESIATVGANFNTLRSARKYYSCHNCGYKPDDYEINTTPQWLQTLTGLDIGVPHLVGKETITYTDKKSGSSYTVERTLADLYDYNNRLDKLVMGLFYSGTNTAVNSYNILYQLVSQLFSGEFSGYEKTIDSIETMLKTSDFTNATKDTNTSGITTFKELFSAGKSYINEFRDYYKATCSTCGHTLYLDVLYVDGQTVKCPYCFGSNISSTVKNGDGYMSLKDIGMAWQNSTSTVSDTDFINFYHKAGTLDLDAMVHYCPTGKIDIINPDSNTETPINLVKADSLIEFLEGQTVDLNVAWRYEKSYGKLTGFSVCLGLSLISRDWNTSVNEVNDKSQTNYGLNEVLSIPQNSGKSDVMYYITNIAYDGTDKSIDGEYNFTVTDGNIITYNGTMTFDPNKSVVSIDDFAEAVSTANDGLKLSVEVRPYFSTAYGTNSQYMYGKTRTYKKHDASNFDGMYTDYGTADYTSALADAYNIYILGDSYVTPILPNPFSTNIYNVTPEIDSVIGYNGDTFESPYIGNYHWINKSNTNRCATFIYEINLGYSPYTYDITFNDSFTLNNNFSPLRDSRSTTYLYGCKEISETKIDRIEYMYKYALSYNASSGASEFDESKIYGAGNVVSYTDSAGQTNYYNCLGVAKPSKYSYDELSNETYWTAVSNDDIIYNYGVDYQFNAYDSGEYVPQKFTDSGGYVYSTVGNISPSTNAKYALTRSGKFADTTAEQVKNYFGVASYRKMLNKNYEESEFVSASDYINTIINTITFDYNKEYTYGDYVCMSVGDIHRIYKFIGSMYLGTSIPTSHNFYNSYKINKTSLTSNCVLDTEQISDDTEPDDSGNIYTDNGTAYYYLGNLLYNNSKIYYVSSESSLNVKDMEITNGTEADLSKRPIFDSYNFTLTNTQSDGSSKVYTWNWDNSYFCDSDGTKTSDIDDAIDSTYISGNTKFKVTFADGISIGTLTINYTSTKFATAVVEIPSDSKMNAYSFLSKSNKIFLSKSTNKTVIEYFAVIPKSSSETYGNLRLYLLGDGTVSENFTKLSKDTWKPMTKYTNTYFEDTGNYYSVTRDTAKGIYPNSGTGWLEVCAIESGDTSNYGYLDLLGEPMKTNQTYITKGVSDENLSDVYQYTSTGYSLNGVNYDFIDKFVPSSDNSMYATTTEFSTDTKYAENSSAIYSNTIYRCNSNICRYTVNDLTDETYWKSVSQELEYIPKSDYNSLKSGTYYLIIQLAQTFGHSDMHSVYMHINAKLNDSESTKVVLDSLTYQKKTDSGEKITVNYPDLNLFFIDAESQNASQNSTIYADIIDIDEDYKYCPKCHRLMLPKNDDGESSYYYYASDYTTGTSVNNSVGDEMNPIVYSKFDSIHRNVVKDADTKVDGANLAFNNSFDGVHCIECGTTLTAIPDSIVDETDSYRGSYWVLRNIEAFNGYFGYHTPTYTAVQRGKLIQTAPYESVYKLLSRSKSFISKYTANQKITVKTQAGEELEIYLADGFAYGNLTDITFPSKYTDITVDNAPSNNEKVIIDNIESMYYQINN